MSGKKALGMFLKLVVDKEDDSEDKIFKVSPTLK